MPPGGVVGMSSHRGGGLQRAGWDPQVSPLPSKEAAGTSCSACTELQSQRLRVGGTEQAQRGGTPRGGQLLTWGIAGRCGAADVGQQVLNVGHGLSLLLIHRGLPRDGGMRGKGVGTAPWV